MKNLKLLSFLMVLASSLMFIQCTTDTLVGSAGADGIAGIDGVDGVNGTDGLDGASIAECTACHSTNHRDAIYDGYAISNHATSPLGSWAYAGKRADCAQCHSNEGFIDFQETGFVNPDGYTKGNPITCNGCHKAHRSFDFVNDGNDYALRTLEPVTLIVDATYTFDAKNESDLMGKSNTCVNCHQPRTASPDPTKDEYTITSTHWGPHHGPQSTLLDGIQGFEFSSAGISAAGSAAHKAKMSCVACHMAKVETDFVLPNGEFDEVSGHSWEPADYASATCTKCHDAKLEVAGFETDMVALAAKLETTVGWEYRYSIVRDAAGDPIYVADRDGNLTAFQFLAADGVTVTTKSAEYVIEEDAAGKIKEEVIGAVLGGHPNAGFYGQGATFTTNDAGAAWNYLFLEEDKSHGVHNPNYAKALIQQSIGAL